ncbi:hypothetical protein EWI07_00035 [Sporolactobacillus sp. THM7-4]|nr:hypothetical protein EWI07_00035 [Sporolactobacillus sp. THM7-4]
MEQALIFGGLSLWGFPLSELLLDKGLNVVSLSSALNEEEKDKEEERSLFLGRNACFHYTEDIVETAFDSIFFADTIRTNQTEKMCLTEKLRRVFTLKSAADTRSFVFLSSTAIYDGQGKRLSETIPVHPVTDEGKAADEMESVFIQELLKLGKVKSASIFRADLTETDDPKDRRRIAEFMSELALSDHGGLEVVHYIARPGTDPESNDKIRKLLGNSFHWD